MRKHIVISAFSARRGGGKTYLSNLLKHFPSDNNIRVTILASKHFDLAQDNSDMRIERILFPVHNPIMRVIWEIFILPFYLRNNDVDLFFCPGGVVPRFGFGSWKTITMFRNMIPFDSFQRRKYPFGYMRIRNWQLYNSMLRSMKTADKVIFISNYAKGVVEKIIDIKRSFVIPHGVHEDFKDVGQFLERPDLLPNEPYIVYPSIIDAYKSQLEVVRAIDILKKQKSKIPMVLFVGETMGQYGSEVRDMIKELHLEKDIIIFGSVDYSNMPALYHFSEFVIFASQSENCPNILLEALASGCAILCSDRMPMPEFAENDVEYFDPTDPESIASEINKFVVFPEKVQHKKKQALQNTSVNDWQKVAEKTWSSIIE
ncbi:glycosyltransferase family 4 protein [Candidatus Pseudothioglobus singularis]|nr:glycosyltransferase family 4 protein [Candidatus Pseudothioglobus singularis]